jgi:hypothetical protein
VDVGLDATVDEEIPEDYGDDTGPNPESRSDIPGPGRTNYVEIPDKVQSGKDDGRAKSGPPTVAEWQDFIGRTVLRFLVEGYLTLVLRDIDHLLTDREREQVRLSRDDLKEIAAPMAELANKSPAMRKRGRLLVASGDSVEAVWTLVFWMRRVNRIAKRHRIEARQQQQTNVRHMQPPTNPNMPNERVNGSGTIRTDQGQGPGTAPGDGFGGPIYNPGTG